MHSCSDSHVVELLPTSLPIFYRTELGALYSGNCLDLLQALPDGSIDCVFADPPFNIGKVYGRGTNDSMPEAEYRAWCQTWLKECARVLAPGGAFFLYHLPRWTMLLGTFLADEIGLEFRHAIAVDLKMGFKISGRLHPSHYSLLYMTKGAPATFRTIRTPIVTCRHCGGDIKDYGGYRKKMHPDGVNLSDVWTDISPVRHRKFKTEGRAANALSTKLLDRVIELTTTPGDIVLDPFGGSGTTFVSCEVKGRRWLGAEIDFAEAIRRRLLEGNVAYHPNTDVVTDT